MCLLLEPNDANVFTAAIAAIVPPYLIAMWLAAVATAERTIARESRIRWQFVFAAPAIRFRLLYSLTDSPFAFAFFIRSQTVTAASVA